MKSAFFLFFLSLHLCSITDAQNDREAIRKRVGEYFTATEKKDWTAVIELIYPKLFNYIPKENMAQVFEDMESEGMEMDLKNFEPRGISETVVFEGEKFALLDYRVGMTIRFTSHELRDSTVQATLKTSFEASYGAENITHHKENFSFDINASRSMFAIAKDGTDEWFFVENDPTQEGLTAMLIPAAVREQLTPFERRN